MQTTRLSLRLLLRTAQLHIAAERQLSADYYLFLLPFPGPALSSGDIGVVCAGMKAHAETGSRSRQQETGGTQKKVASDSLTLSSGG